MSMHKVKDSWKSTVSTNASNKSSCNGIDVNKPIEVMGECDDDMVENGGNLIIKYVHIEGGVALGYIDDDMLEEWDNA